MKSMYLIGSLRNPEVPTISARIREQVGLDVFDDWFAAGPIADDCWRDYEKAKGHSYAEGLEGYACNHVYEFDKHHLNRCDAACLLMPAGKSGHLELGYAIGRGKRGFIILDDPERWDVMYRFAERVFPSVEHAIAYWKGMN